MSHTNPTLAARKSLRCAICRRPAKALAFLLLLAWTGTAGAHTGAMTGFATITISEKSVRYSLTLSDIPPGSLADQMRLGRPGTPPDYQTLIATISEKIHLASEGASCTAAEGRIVPPSDRKSTRLNSSHG